MLCMWLWCDTANEPNFYILCDYYLYAAIYRVNFICYKILGQVIVKLYGRYVINFYQQVHE